MARFSQYPAASSTDYTDDVTFLILAPDGTVKQATLEGLSSNYFCDIRCASVVIPTASVLTLNATPIEIVAAQGAGKFIEVISASVSIVFNSVAYATNTNLQVINSGSTIEQFGSPTLDASVTQIANFSAATPSAAQVQLTSNTALNVSVKSGDPTAGNSDITVYVLYRVVTI